MSRFEIKNWCPGALRPMQSGDGLVVRIRPRGSKFSPTQAKGIAETSAKHGNGLIDLTARANVQLRGVQPESHAALIGDLKALGLIDHDVAAESRRNIVVTPFRCGRYEAETVELAAEVETLLERGPVLPSKFGFAIDTGPAPVLTETSADIRLERAASGRLIVRADGSEVGRAVAPSEAAAAMLELAVWFVRSGGVREGRGRMAAHIASGANVPDTEQWTITPAEPSHLPTPGPRIEGFLVGAEFGQLSADVLGRLATMEREIRVTPWRMLLLVGVDSMPDSEGLITNANHPWLSTTACTGALGCLQGLARTRELARALSPHVPPGAHLHVSGCAKGCAHPAPATVTLCATRDGFDLIRNGRADETAVKAGLGVKEILARPQSLFEVS